MGGILMERSISSTDTLGRKTYDTDRENSPLYQEDVLYNKQDPEV